MAALLVGCAASIPPPELLDARQAYAHASASPATHLEPASLRRAQETLLRAEKAFQSDPEANETRALAKEACRLAQLAEKAGASTRDSALIANAFKEHEKGRGTTVKDTSANPPATERGGAREGKLPASEPGGKLEAANRATDTKADFWRFASTRQDARGLILTLSGSDLFAPGKSVLLPAMLNKLNVLASALLTTRDRRIAIEGHTDSRGSSSLNKELSQLRADAVRSYFISRGYPRDMITSQGFGKDRPIADNGSTEGRENNRRIEIIIDQSASPPSGL